MAANLKQGKVSGKKRKNADKKDIRAHYQSFVAANDVPNGLLSMRGCIEDHEVCTWEGAPMIPRQGTRIRGL